MLHAVGNMLFVHLGKAAVTDWVQVHLLLDTHESPSHRD
ncbi:hypothetical protein NVIRPANT_00253 [Pantoea sp. Nvir]|nr:hypothetical protein NVIRPANT_00253 [Pantoea sp. Nvir]